MKTTAYSLALVVLICGTLCTCRNNRNAGQAASGDPIPVILDTDANNELDDQHAIAYLLLSRNAFEPVGITVNATRSGGNIESHTEEANRVVRLVGMEEEVPVIPGANGDFRKIAPHIREVGFDGYQAVDFMIREAWKERNSTLVLLPVGKLTNVALALLKDPSIAERIRVVWLGSNYPDPGEYNQDNDTAALNFILEHEVPFEIATVRGGTPSGTAHVKVTKSMIEKRMPGLGPRIDEQVTGRHGGSFTTFGDYSVNLFEHIRYHGDSRSRSLYDMAAVAIVKNPSWAEAEPIPAPILVDNRWMDRPENDRWVLLWENFDREKILEDFFETLENSTDPVP